MIKYSDKCFVLLQEMPSFVSDAYDAYDYFLIFGDSISASFEKIGFGPESKKYDGYPLDWYESKNVEIYKDKNYFNVVFCRDNNSFEASEQVLFYSFLYHIYLTLDLYSIEKKINIICDKAVCIKNIPLFNGSSFLNFIRCNVTLKYVDEINIHDLIACNVIFATNVFRSDLYASNFISNKVYCHTTNISFLLKKGVLDFVDIDAYTRQNSLIFDIEKHVRKLSEIEVAYVNSQECTSYMHLVQGVNYLSAYNASFFCNIIKSLKKKIDESPILNTMILKNASEEVENDLKKIGMIQ